MPAGQQALEQLSNAIPRREDACGRRDEGSAPDAVFAALEPDVLVICAGALAPAAPIQEQSWEDFSANWETDVKASFLFCKAALSARSSRGAGSC